MGLVEDIKITAKVSDFVEAYDFEVYDILRVNNFFVQNRPILYIIIGLYLLGIFFGQKWMKNRPAYNLSSALFFWNLALAGFSIIATVRALPELVYLLSKKDGFYLATCSREVHNYATSFWSLMFLLSKIMEFGDTAFIVLRKQKLIVLHWFHHMATLYICWLGYESYETAGRFFVLNTFVHSFMYSYYALKACKVKIPRKFSQALTILQISQMIFFLVAVMNCGYSMAVGKHCPINPELLSLGWVIGVIFTVLFINFYVHAYRMKPADKIKST